MKGGSLHARSFRRIHFSVLTYRWTKSGFTGPKSFRGFRQTAPRAGLFWSRINDSRLTELLLFLLYKCFLLLSLVYMVMINNGNWTEWSAVWSEIIRVICLSKYDFRPKLHDPITAVRGFRLEDRISTDPWHDRLTLILTTYNHLNRQDRPTLRQRGEWSWEYNGMRLLCSMYFFFAILPRRCFDDVTNKHHMGPNLHWLLPNKYCPFN